MLIRFLSMLEFILIAGVLWAGINAIHAVATMDNKTVNSGFFWLSNKIKKDIKGEGKGTSVISDKAIFEVGQATKVITSVEGNELNN